MKLNKNNFELRFTFCVLLGQKNCGAWPQWPEKTGWGWEPQKAHSLGHWPDLAARQGKLCLQYLYGRENFQALLPKHTLHTAKSCNQQYSKNKKGQSPSCYTHAFPDNCVTRESSSAGEGQVQFLLRDSLRIWGGSRRVRMKLKTIL